jgi:fructose-bisphosphate aldolase, class II
MKRMKMPALEILNSAYGKFGVTAYNVFNAEQIHGVFGETETAGIPIIVQITPAARNNINQKFMEGMVTAAENIYPSVNYSVINQIKRKLNENSIIVCELGTKAGLHSWQ